MINRRAVEFGVRTALALSCAVNQHNRFARKHYYYPDMPKNYQISQYEEPLAEHGQLAGRGGRGRTASVGIERLHLEEDVGKLVHEGDLATSSASKVDFNRAGVPLMEIVSRPDLRSPEAASAYLKTLRTILLYLGVCDGNMEEGSLRCDANVSLRPSGRTELGTKVEIKNLNSFRHVQRALEYEVARQARGAGRRRAHRAGDAALGSGARPHRLHALQGVRARLPLLPGAGPAAARHRSGVGGGGPPGPSRAAGGAPPALHGGPSALPLRGRPADPGPRSRRLLRGRRRGVPDGEDRRQLGAERAAAGAAGGRRPGGGGGIRRPGPARRAPPARRRRHHQRQDRQGRVRQDVPVGRGRRAPSSAARASPRSPTRARSAPWSIGCWPTTPRSSRTTGAARRRPWGSSSAR